METSVLKNTTYYFIQNKKFLKKFFKIWDKNYLIAS